MGQEMPDLEINLLQAQLKVQHLKFSGLKIHPF